MAPQSKNRFDASLGLDDLNPLLEQSERPGFVLTKIEAVTVDDTKLNAAVFDAKMPNDGPYSQVIRKQDPLPPRTRVVFSSEIFVKGDKTQVNVVR